MLCLLLLQGLGAQELGEEVEPFVLVAPAAEILPTDRLMLAISAKNYPVTPGDIYRLTFLIAGDTVSNEILVESDYTLNLNIFGKVNAENMSFSELKPIVEKIISDAYPGSLPFFNIESVGNFQVLIKGEVPQTSFITAWGLSRLSEIIQDNLGPYSSIREIGIISKDGRLKKYDLYKALHLGIIEEDPYIMPGDTVIMYRQDRVVEINGEIYRPGRYQILKNEGLRELINLYGGGFTNLADTSRIKLDRFAGENPRTFYFGFTKSLQPSFELEDGDVLTIPTKLANLPVVVFEGAVVAAAVEAAVELEEEEIGFEIYNRITHPFIEGESLFDALLSIRESIAPAADLSKAYVIREGSSQPIPVNLEKLLYAYTPSDDMALQPFDRIVIPAHRFYISVTGSVDSPGSYPYVPQKTYSYYVSLTGSIPPGEPVDYISIIDANGNPRGLNEIIQPEDRIMVTSSLIPVSGAVYTPGSYPFTPGKSYSYYVDLAGGIDPERNTDNPNPIDSTDITKAVTISVLSTYSYSILVVRGLYCL
ncbi:hypothetical protein ES703_89130 [subsurface metagenome]